MVHGGSCNFLKIFVGTWWGLLLDFQDVCFREATFAISKTYRVLKGGVQGEGVTGEP